MSGNSESPNSVFNTKVTDEDIQSAITDSFSVSYSYNGKKLLCTGGGDLELYEFKPIDRSHLR